MHRETAGNGGQTVVDIHKNDITIFTNQANRPTIAAASGSNIDVSSGTIDVTSLAAGDTMKAFIDEKEGGNAKDLSVTVEVQY
jgi:hypothetical protein